MDPLESEVAAEQEATDEIRIENRRLRAALDRQKADSRELQKLLGLLESIDGDTKPPKWTLPSKRKGSGRGIVTLQLTDTHFEEVVTPAEVAFINAYSPDIAEQRLRRWVEGSIATARRITGIEYDGCAVLATGDIMSGDIHAELRESNARPLFEGADYWIDRLLAAIDMLREEFGTVHIAAVVGNHGRLTQKPIYKKRAQSNIEWFIWRQVARYYRDDERVTLQVSDAMDLIVPLYDTNYLLTHGDEFKGGSGIQGARAPLSIGQHRTTVRQMATDQPMDFMVVGHFHQYMPPSQGLVMGGSMKGYDEFAFGKRFRPEPAQQAFWITMPVIGPELAKPLLLQDRKAEGW